jgi:ATP-dependent exoDNAse (exonuclease V) beta subunit
MLGKGWLDVARFWGQLLESGFAIKTVETELSIGKAKPAEVQLPDLNVKLRGSIDAAHRSGDLAVLVDYKSSTVPQKRLISVGLEPQLPIYAEAFSQSKVDRDDAFSTSQKNIAAIYFNLRDGKPTVAAVGADIKPLLQSCGIIGRNTRPEDMEEAVQAVRSRWLERLDSIRDSKRFEADPSDCDYCPFDGVCRKDDPRYRDAIAAQVKAGAL